MDIAETTDLCCAKILVMKADRGEKFVLSKYFIPEGKLSKSDDKSAGARYEEWARDGMLKIGEGNYVNTAIIADWFYEMYKTYGFRPVRVGYDAKFANEFINRMDEYGFETESVWQRPEVMNLPIKMAEADLKDRLVAGLNVMDKWCLGNATLVVNARGEGILDKIKGQVSRKIDGAVTLTILYEVFRRYRQPFLSKCGGR